MKSQQHSKKDDSEYTDSLTLDELRSYNNGLLERLIAIIDKRTDGECYQCISAPVCVHRQTKT